MEIPLAIDTPLGTIQVEPNSSDNDFSVSERVKTFSTELLRVSLLAIVALGFLLEELILSKRPVNSPKSGLLTALVLFFIAASCAQFHRHYGTSSVSCHLQSLRYFKRSTASYLGYYRIEGSVRNRILRISKVLLISPWISLLEGIATVLFLFNCLV